MFGFEVADAEHRQPPQRVQFPFQRRGRKVPAQQEQRVEITRTAQFLEAERPQPAAVGPPLVIEPVVNLQQTVQTLFAAVLAIIERQRQEHVLVQVHEIEGLLTVNRLRGAHRIERLGHRIFLPGPHAAADKIRLAPAAAFDPGTLRILRAQIPPLEASGDLGNLLRRSLHGPDGVRLRTAVFHKIGDQAEIRAVHLHLEIGHLLPRDVPRKLQAVQVDGPAPGCRRKTNLHGGKPRLGAFAHILPEFVPHTAPTPESEFAGDAADIGALRIAEHDVQRLRRRALVINPEGNASVRSLGGLLQSHRIPDADDSPGLPVDLQRRFPQFEFLLRIAQPGVLCTPRIGLRSLKRINLCPNACGEHQQYGRQQNQVFLHKYVWFHIKNGTQCVPFMRLCVTNPSPGSA